MTLRLIGSLPYISIRFNPRSLTSLFHWRTCASMCFKMSEGEAPPARFSAAAGWSSRVDNLLAISHQSNV